MGLSSLKFKPGPVISTKYVSPSSLQGAPAKSHDGISILLFLSWVLRNNISHHGKGSEHELEKVLRSTVDHFNTLLEFVKLVSPRLAEKYKDLTQIKIVM